MHKDNLPFWKHPWICLTKRPGNYDSPSLWLWVNNILLDSSNEALVVDCCILLASSRVSPAFIRLGAALEYCRAFGSSTKFIEVRQCFERLDYFFSCISRDDAPYEFP